MRFPDAGMTRLPTRGEDLPGGGKKTSPPAAMADAVAFSGRGAVTFGGASPDWERSGNETLRLSARAMKRHYFWMRARNLFLTPDPSKEAHRLADKVWREAFEPLYAHPVQTKRMVENWRAEIDKSVANPFGRSILRTVAQGVPDKKFTRRVVDLFADAMVRDGYERLLPVVQSEAFAQGDTAKKFQLIFETLDAPTVERLYRQAWDRVLTPTLAETLPHQRQAWKAGVIAAIPDTGLRQGMALLARDLDPQWLRTVSDLMYDTLSQNEGEPAKRLRDLLMGPAFADFQAASAFDKMQMALHAFDAKTLRKAYEDTRDRIVMPVLEAATPEVRADWEAKVRDAISNPALREAAAFMVKGARHPQTIRKVLDLAYDTLADGGVARLEKIAALVSAPEYDALSPEESTRKILAELDPEFLERASDRLWQGLIEPMLDDPGQMRVTLHDWKIRAEKNIAQPMMKSAALALIDYLDKNLDRPDRKNRLREFYNLAGKIMQTGGVQKAEKLLLTFQSAEFKQAEPVRQGQLLLESLGPLFIKGFQTLSTMPGLFGDEIQSSMERLYENISPVPFPEVRRIVERELGKPLEEAFVYFDETCMKAGSIAQLHKAGIRDPETGDVTDVVVKVVKDGMEESLGDDFALAMPLVALAEELAPGFDVRDLFKDFQRNITNECYMTRRPEGPKDAGGEAERLKRMTRVFQDNPKIRVPKVYDSHTTQRLLTMSFCEGKSLKNFKGDVEVAKKYLALMMEQIFTLGAVQADPHPGNVLYDAPNDTFSLIDGGLFYFIDRPQRIEFAKLLLAMVSKDSDLISEALVTKPMLAHPKFAEFKRRMADMVLDPDQMNEKSTAKFMKNALVEAGRLGLETVQINPLLWKSLFTSVMVARTIDPGVSLTRAPAVLNIPLLLFDETDINFKLKSALGMLRNTSVGRALGGALGDYWDRFGRWSGLGGGRKS